MPISTVTDVVDVLGRYRILDASRLAEIKRDLQTRFPEQRALCRELVQRNWLTPYQATQVLQGKAAELVISSYIVLDLLGAGGVGQVFKAKHNLMNRVVSIKVLRKDVLGDQETVGRFYREIEAVSQIDHPNIVHAYDAGPFGASLYLAMEFVEGVDLDKLVREKGALLLPDACEFIRQAAHGLQHAHERGLIHRDIKPSNLLLSYRPGMSNVVKILDMGLARLTQQPQQAQGSSTHNLTVLGGGSVMQGTPDYMAPEQALDFHTADTRSDIYSLGCTFYFLLTGQPPFAGGSLSEKLIKHQMVEPKPVEEVRKEIPKRVGDILRKMMAKRPEDRFPIPGELAQALGKLVAPRKKKADSGSSDSIPALPPDASSTSLGTSSGKSSVNLGEAKAKANGDSESAASKSPSTARLQAVLKTNRKKLILASTVGGIFVVLVILMVVASSLLAPDPPVDTARPAATSETTGKIASTRVHVPDKPLAKTGQGRIFDGKTNYIDEPHRPELDPAELTVAVWANPTVLPGADEKRRWIVNKNGHEGVAGHFGLLLNSKKLGAYLNIGGQKYEAFSNRDVLRVNSWQHFAMTYNGVALRVFHDGQEVAFVPIDKPRTPGTTPLTIGRRQDGYDKSYFNGRLDDVRLYKRVLDADEIKAQAYQPDLPPNRNDKSLVFQVGWK